MNQQSARFNFNQTTDHTILQICCFTWNGEYASGFMDYHKLIVTMNQVFA
ncbi:Uncharacterised protein [Mycobacteroides abscessus subsp. abscessus]|nr:Uncharacterised protein [Mycobacteroides abscessus subsp. abscessus]